MTILTLPFLFELLTVLATILLGILAYVNYKYSYWSRVGIPSLTPKFPYGITANKTEVKIFAGEVSQQKYNKVKQNGYKHAGLYSFKSPVYMPVDPELIKHILQKDFQHFVNHGIIVNDEHDPLNAHLFNLEDDKWRKMRVKMTPTFTSGKMKMMFQTMVDCSRGFKEIMDDAAKNHTPLDIKDILARFTTDIIGSIAFGLECNSLKNPDAEFRRYGRRIFQITKNDILRRRVLSQTPLSIQKLFKLKVINVEVERFFMNAIRDTINYREKNNITRKDFMQMLIQLKNKGFVSDDDKDTDDGKIEKGLTFNEIAAQAYLFFVAGFETSSTTMTFALCEIGSNQEIQKKMRDEIKTVLAKYDGKLSYDAIMEMTYMEKVIQETLRKYPPVTSLPRICTKDWTVPNTDIVIEKGTRVTIPVLGIHRDPEFYPDPEKFDPERFTEENKKTRPDFTWLPFGDGPRHCIGLRFGLLQTRVGLLTLLKDHKIKLSSKTEVPIKFEPRAFISSVRGGAWIEVEKIE